MKSVNTRFEEKYNLQNKSLLVWWKDVHKKLMGNYPVFCSKKIIKIKKVIKHFGLVKFSAIAALSDTFYQINQVFNNFLLTRFSSKCCPTHVDVGTTWKNFQYFDEKRVRHVFLKKRTLYIL